MTRSSLVPQAEVSYSNGTGMTALLDSMRTGHPDIGAQSLSTRVRRQVLLVKHLPPLHQYPLAIRLTEATLLHVCALLAADSFELVDNHVTFFKRCTGGVTVDWAGDLGDYLLPSGHSWRISSGQEFQTSWASIA
jgi:hypothetical protein